MNDLRMINQAIHDTMRQVSPETRFIVVLWQQGVTGAAISSNELDTPKVVAVLKDAAGIVANSEPHHFRFDDEIVGNA